MYPNFEFDGEWKTSVVLKSWSGFQIRRGKYNSVSSPEMSDGKIFVTLIGESDESEDPSEEGRAKIDWLIENQDNLLVSALNILYCEYPSIQDEWNEFHGAEVDEQLPSLESPEDLKALIGEPTIFIHPRVTNHRYYIGITAACSWDIEHGIGWLMLGTEARIVGDAEVAITDWILDQDASKVFNLK